MEFYEVLDQVIDLLKLRKCVTYRACKAQFQLDEALLETLNDELLFSHSVVDENGRGLVWTGGKSFAPTPLSSDTRPDAAQPGEPEHDPLSYTAPNLTEKILAARSALESESLGD